MSEPTTAPLTMLQPLGESAGMCEGDFCVVPPHHEQQVVNARVDADTV